MAMEVRKQKSALKEGGKYKSVYLPFLSVLNVTYCFFLAFSA